MSAPRLIFEDPPTIHLRPYQEDAVSKTLEAMSSLQSGLVIMPTGTGKTTVFSEIIRRAHVRDPEFATLMLAHRSELLDQGRNRIADQNPNLIVSIEAADQRASLGADVVVAGVQTIGRPSSTRLDWFSPKMIITDEAHHACADSYVAIYRRYGCIGDAKDAFHLGVTATPHRLDNKPLHGSEASIFQEVIYKYTLREAIADKWLCDLRGYRTKADGLDLSGVKTVAGDFNQGQLQERMNTDPVNEHAFKSWADVASQRRTIVFCAGVEHARDMAAVFRSRGIAAEHVDGTMPADVRSGIMRRFKSGETQVLTNVDIATEGFDVPAVACVLLLRPTQSWALYTQMVGRGTRLSPGKEDCTVIDVVGNTDRHALGKIPATLAGLVGLPSQMSLDGHTLSEAIELFDQLDEGAQAQALKRCTDFAGLTVELQAVDLLAELEIADELADFAQFSWLKIDDERFFLDCGSSGAHAFRYAELLCNTIGIWSLRMHCSEFDRTIALESDFEGAVRRSESLLREHYAGVHVVCSRKATWKGEPPTDKQLRMLTRLKASPAVVQSLKTKGQASQLISKLMQGRQ